MNSRPLPTTALFRPILACAVLAVACTNQTARADLVAYWPFNDSGTLGTDAANSNVLTVNGATHTANGRNGGGLALNGTNQYLSGTVASLPVGNGAYTLAAWIKPTATGARGIVGWGNYGSLRRTNALRLNSSNGIINYWWAADISATVSADWSGGTWHHVAATYDGTTRRLFHNGAQVASDTPGVNDATAANFRIGSANNGEYFQGTLDDVAIYNHALSAGDVADLANGATPLSAPPTDITLTPGSIEENNTAGDTVGALATVGGTGPFTFTLVSGAGATDNASFSIDGTNLNLNLAADYETKNSYSIRVRAGNGAGKTFEKALVISVTNVNEAPTFQTRQLLYETVNPTRVSGAIQYSVNNSAALAALALQRVAYRMEVTVAGVPRYAEVSFDAWAGLTVAGLRVPVPSSPLVIQRNVTNLNVESNYPGVVNATGQTGRLEIWPWNYSQTANAGVGGSSSTYDFDDTHSGSHGYGSFQVHNLSSTPKQTVLAWNNHGSGTPDIGFGNNTGNAHPDWTFMGASSLGKTNWKLQIFSDGSYFTLVENAPAGTAAGTFVAQDPDAGDSITYSFATGDGDDDNGSFTLNGAVLRSAVPFDYEEQTTRTVRVRATDSGGAYTEQAFTIIIQDLDDSPTDITLTPATVVENNAPGATVGTLAAVGGTGGYGFTLVSGTGDADNASYEIDGTALKILISADYEAGASHAIRVRADDGAGSFLEKALTITITNVPELQIAVFDGTVGGGAALTDNTGTVDYGDVVRGTSSAARLFTLHNPGDTTLTGISVAKAGTGTPGDFTLDTTSLAASLAPGQSTTFTVTFTPGTYGARTSRLDIASSDAARSPFEVHLTGASTATEALARTNLAMTPAEGLEDGGMLYRPLTGVINQDGRVTFRAFGKVGSGGIITGNDSLLLSDASGSLQVVAREGAQAGATASHKFMGAFTHYLLTESGQTIALDRIRGASAATDYAYVTSPDGVTLEMLSREGEAAPGGGNFNIHTAKPAADSLGRMYFSGDLTGAGVTAKTDSGIWQEDSGTMRLLAREGADLSGLTGDAAWLGGVAAMVAAGGDGVAFIAQLQNNPENAKQRTLAARNAVVLAGNEDGMEVILRKGDTVPGTSGRELNLLSGVSRSATGAHAVLGNLKAGSGVTATNNGVLVAVADGVPRLVARKGVTSIGGRPLARFIAFHAVGDDTVVFSTDSALCRWTVAGGLEELALKGQPAPGLGSNHAVISTLSVSPGGAIAVTTRLVDGRAVLWRALPGEALSRVVASGEDILVEGVPVTILNLAVHDAGEGVGGGGGGMGSAINDSGHVFVNLSLGNGLHVARIYP